MARPMALEFDSVQAWHGLTVVGLMLAQHYRWAMPSTAQPTWLLAWLFSPLLILLTSSSALLVRVRTETVEGWRDRRSMNPPRNSAILGPSPVSCASASIVTEATASVAADVVDHSAKPVAALIDGLVMPSSRYDPVKIWWQYQVESSRSELEPRCRQY